MNTLPACVLGCIMMACVLLQFTFVFSTAAACVASQAMISAAFSIIQQSIALGCFPRLTVRHVSEKVQYICFLFLDS
jgi:K+ transporter